MVRSPLWPWVSPRCGWCQRCLCVPKQLPAAQSLPAKRKLLLWHQARNLTFPSARTRGPRTAVALLIPWTAANRHSWDNHGETWVRKCSVMLKALWEEMLHRKAHQALVVQWATSSWDLVFL